MIALMIYLMFAAWMFFELTITSELRFKDYQESNFEAIFILAVSIFWPIFATIITLEAIDMLAEDLRNE